MNIFINLEDTHPHLIPVYFQVTDEEVDQYIELKISFLFLEIFQYLEYKAFK